MSLKTKSKLDRLQLFKETERLHSDPENYMVYISKSDSAELNDKITRGSETVTLKDIIDGKLNGLIAKR